MTESSRRVSKRHNVKWSARLLLPNNKIISATAKNISSEGAYVEANTGWQKGATIKLELNPFLAGQSFQLRMSVVIVRDMLLSNNRGVGLGLLFKDMTEANQTLLASIIKHLKT